MPAGSHASLCTVPGIRAGSAAVRHTQKRRPATEAELRHRSCPGFRSGGSAPRRRDAGAAVADRHEERRGADHAAVRPRPARGRCGCTGPRGTRRRTSGMSGWFRWGRPARNYWPHRSRALWDVARRRGCSQRARTGRGATRPTPTRGVCAGPPRPACGCEPYACRHPQRSGSHAYGLDAARAMLGQRSLGSTNLYASAADLETAVNVALKLG